MDYSLLLGLEKDRKELVVGIVDSIGSYDLWKTIESKGKMLTRGGDVTVVSLTFSECLKDLTDGQIPPDQYKNRFEIALNRYLLVRALSL
jgi:1-phosphatidylinositol-3-phosphate 5-kinase